LDFRVKSVASFLKTPLHFLFCFVVGAFKPPSWYRQAGVLTPLPEDIP